jgi:ribosomal-protein-alanine N-acetyltransferase
MEHEPMHSIDQAEKRVKGRISLFEKGLGCRWAITFKNNPKDVIGSCGYFSVRVGSQTMEIGFDIHPDHWRRGIMTEALTAVLDYSFGESAYFPVNRVEALVDPSNKNSIKLLTRLGFIDECTRREFGYWKGAYQDVKVFALLRKDWKS